MKLLDEHGGISEEILAVAANTNDLMFVKTKDFVYIAVSKAFARDFAGCSSVDEVIGKTDLELFSDSKMAEHYREEDERLLSSGKDRMEFEEEYEDLKGKTHRCMVSRYLITDSNDQPAAIWGQFREKDGWFSAEPAENKDLSRKASLALCRPFFVANYVDLTTHTYTTMWAMDYVRDMMKDCDTAEKGFAEFIRLLVKPEFAEDVHTFCDLNTLTERLKGKKQIDYEYLSYVASGWCKISFYPCEWDENGEVTHVLFTVAAVDEGIAKGIEESRANKRDIETIFNEVPGGIALYQWTGRELKVLKMSRFYQEIYGCSEMNQKGNLDFGKIHPDDLADYQKAIHQALTETHRLEYVFRIWNQKRDRYGWSQINAISKPQPDGTSYVYAVYTDVTDRKIAELRLSKSQASIMASLGASEQYSYEYDPVMHTSTSFSEENNGYKLDTVIENYPECFRSNGFMHPDDVEMFIETTHRIDEGAENAHCVIRADKDGKYRWHSCTFDAFYDWEKNYRIALLTVVDITPQVMAKKDYEERIRSLLSVQDNILTMCTFNLVQDTYEMVHMEDISQKYAGKTASFEETILAVSEDIVDADSREAYCRTFSRDNLLKQAALGNMHLQQEYLLKLADDHYEWVTAIIDLLKNPLTDEISGVGYCKSTQKSHMERELLASALKLDFIFSAIVFKDTDEYYVYNSEADSFDERLEHFWDTACAGRSRGCSQENAAYITKFYNKETMCRYLDHNPEFSYAFDSNYSGEPRRLEAKFRYLDKNHSTIIVTMRDITDQGLQEQWRYDSEHDALTGLLNRKTVYEQSRRLLTEYPDTQFVMLHCDVKHFHLYNTFFGEEAGDKLLCRIANFIQSLKDDYSCFTCGRIESDVFCAFFSMQKEVFEKHVRLCFRGLKDFSPDFPLELAIGVYPVTDPSMSLELMFTRATIAAKSGERNLFGLISRYDDTMDRNLKDTQQITSEMVAAIEQEQFEVYLQPKVSLRSEKLMGAEALVRWKHTERGMISPGVFIPVFEKNGFIARLDRYMWEHTCQILRRWQDEGKAMYPVSVNISRVSMYNRATVPFLKSLVEKYALDPEYLELELTESAYMDDPGELKHMLKDLQEYGFKILMDDFGSGYSSLNTLRELPVNMLKLDMKFLSDSLNDPRGNAVLSSVVRMSQMLRLPIVAEGVELREQAEYLRELGCEYAQGYLFARPMPVEEYEKLLNEAGTEDMAITAANGAGTAIRDQQYEKSVPAVPDERYTSNAAQMVRAIDNTGIRMFMYFPQTKIINVPEKTCAAYGCAPVYANMPHSFAEDYVHPEDYAVFKEMYYRIDRGEKTADATFHSKDYKYCNHVTLTTVSWSKDGKPKDVFGLIEDRSDQFHNERFIKTLQEKISASDSAAEMDEVLKHIAVAIGGQYYAVYYIWLEDHTYICMQEKLPGILSLIGERGEYEQAWEKYIHLYIEEQEQDEMRRFVEISSLAERLSDKGSITHIYRRKEVGWTRGQFIPAKWDEKGRLQAVIYTVSDINAEVENDRKRKAAEQEALRDPMTGLLNRKAFEQYIKSEKFTNHPTGLMLFDIDRFKSVNDQYGHEMGDQVIRTVCEHIINALRRDDLVFRMGGDEFAVLLYECKEGVWNSTCRKFSQLHMDVRESLQEDIHVTLSGGLCLNPTGYCREMYSLADQALYHTKANGRGGCTMIGMDGNICQEWHDTSTVL